MSEKRVLITGAAGLIGRVLAEQLRHQYAELRLGDIAAGADGVMPVDIRNLATLETAMAGIDCVVHLAGVPGEDAWANILATNIDGCYNVFEAARRQRVRRVVFASSNHAVGFHRRAKALDSGVTVRPDTRYGVSKVFGEALGRLYADKYGLSVACLRIGTFRTPDRPSELRQLRSWVSHRDLAQLVQRCIDHPDYHFLIAYGVSGNTRSNWSNADVAFLGYAPQDDSERFAPEILALNATEDPLAAQFHGGFYCPIEFDGDATRID
ncbi:MAG: NAD(P)-dependent oxidoreductase [Burkholderiaceae bacterium]